MPIQIFGPPSAMAIASFEAIICVAGVVASLVVIASALKGNAHIESADTRRQRNYGHRVR